MLKTLPIFLFLLIFLTPSGWSQDNDKDNRLRERVRQYGQADVTVQNPGRRTLDLLSRNVSVVSVRGKTVYITLSPRTVEWFISGNYAYNISERPAARSMIAPRSVQQAMEWQTYPTYTQYDSIMRSFAVTYPSLCRLDTIGTSVMGRYVFALKISDNPLVNEDEPDVFYSSTIHGDETGGFILMLRLADWLLKNYGTSARASNMVNNLQIWINPLANPDGTYTTGNTITSPTRFNKNGYDLNRNFPDPVTPYTTGNVEQKETIDMVKFLRKQRFVISANFHAGDEVVNYPWDYNYNKKSPTHADDIWFTRISRAYADTAHLYGPSYMTGFNNGIVRGTDWYSITGGRQDFITWNLQGREVTIELDFNKITPAGDLEQLWQYNWHSLIGYLENSLWGIHGIVKDAKTSDPVAAKVFIAAHDIDSSQVYSDTLTGRFIRMLQPGSWNLTFSAKGYKDTTINNIQVLDRERTDITVMLNPVITGIDTTNPPAPQIYPDPASSYIFARLPEKLAGQVNIKIYSLTGAIVMNIIRDYTFGYPIDIGLGHLSAGEYLITFRNSVSGVSCSSRFIIK